MGDIRVGILGPGLIAEKFADSLEYSENCRLVAAGSRDIKRAQQFVERYDRPGRQVKAYGDYEELVADPNIDLIYVATPHSLHCEHTLLSLRAKKNVLCEKPLAMNATEVAKMIGEARMQGKFLMEAMWTRTIPAVRRAKNLIDQGAVGELSLIQADLGWAFPIDYEHRIYNPKLGGGATLDLGIYPIAFAAQFAGLPVTVSSAAVLANTGVDGTCVYTFKHKGRTVSALYASMLASTPSTATLYGTEGRIWLGPRFLDATRLVIGTNDGRETAEDYSYPAFGYQFEADEAARCIIEGLDESPLMPLDESIALSRIMDKILADAGVKYPS